MSSKELTAYVVDLSPSMAQSYNSSDTQLSHGLKYVYNSIVSKIHRGRVTDYVTVLAFHSKQSNYSDDDEFKGINVISNKVAPSLRDLRHLKRELIAGGSNPSTADSVKAFEVAAKFIQEPTKGVFIRNLVLVTNGYEYADFTSENLKPTIELLNNLHVNVTVIAVGMNSINSQSVSWSFWKSIALQIDHGVVLDSADVESVVFRNPPLKKVEPRALFKGKLRFGADVGSNDTSKGLQFDIEIFPGTMASKPVPFHNYLVDEDEIKDVSASYIYYIEAQNEKGELEKKPVEKGDWTDGYRYTNKDIMAVHKELLEAAKLPGQPSMDIIGFIKVDDLPVAYFTDDSRYLVPSKYLNKKNLVGYNCLCGALLDKEMAALVRFVQKENDEVKVCALVPARASAQQKHIYTMQIVRLPFKEDEKVGHFPSFSAALDDKSKQKKEAELQKVMDDFVLSRDLDKGIQESSDAYLISNEKIDMASHQTLGDKLKTDLDSDVNSRLSASNPALHKFHTNLYKIIEKAAETDDLRGFLEDPDFIDKYMTSDDTNLFNLENILLNQHSLKDSQWLSRLNATDSVTRKMGQYTTPFRPTKKSKRSTEDKVGAGTYGENEGEYEIIDIDELFV